MTCSGAVVAAIDLAVMSLRFAHCFAATLEVTEIDAIPRSRQARAASRVNLMIAIVLSILVDVVLCHDEPPRI
jgi:hypothetical protein